MLAFVASDGSIEFRDRINMTSIEPYGDTTTVSSLPHAGFEQMMTEHNPHVAMSADGSAMAMIKTDGSLVHRMMTLRYSWQPLRMALATPEA
jgi:mediator of RNA polymerase II transcription subunit 16